MKQKDIIFIKNSLDNDFLLNDYLCIKQVRKDHLKIFYNDLIITICSFGFAYLVSWYAEGSITSSKADAITRLCHAYNGRF